MKKLFSAAVLALLIATPAVAKTHLVTRHDMREAPVSLGGPQAYNGDLAIKNGQVVGEDPDARVRFELSRDNPTY